MSHFYIAYKIMNAIRIHTTVESETLHLPELKALLGRRVEIIVLDEELQRNGDRLPADEIDRDFAELAELCAQGDSADEARLQHALREAKRQAKEQVRRDMGLG